VSIRKDHVLAVIQLSSLCNLDCSYCYVPDRLNRQMMGQALIDKIIALTVGAPENIGKRIEFLFHAGEPLAVGLEPYRHFVARCREACIEGVAYGFSVQTNGTLINDKWAEFFIAHDFTIGVSIDGPQELHDAKRVGWSGRGSHAKSVAGVKVLQAHGLADFGCLAVAGLESLKNPRRTVSYFYEELGVASVGFNIEDIEGENTSTSFGDNREARRQQIRRELVEPFYLEVFDYWWPIRDRFSIREFADVMYHSANLYADADYTRDPDVARDLGILTFMKDGSITTYAPEFAGARAEAYGNFVVGNVMNIQSLDEIRKSPAFRKLQRDVQQGISNCRTSCEYFAICGGSHIPNRFFEYGDFTRPDTFTCEMMLQAAADVCYARLATMDGEVTNAPKGGISALSAAGLV
jgi:uncharacterized protein